MAKTQSSSQSGKDIPSQPRLEGAVQNPTEIAHAALSFTTTAGAVIRVYRMRMPRGVERVIAEKLREGSLKIWDPISEAEVEVVGGDLASAFGLSLGKLGPHLGFDTVL